MASREGPLPLPRDPRLCVHRPAKNPYASVKCLHSQMLTTHSKTKHCGAKGNRWKVPSGPAGRRVSHSSSWVFAGRRRSAHTVSFTSNRIGEAAPMVPPSQPRKLRPREGKPPTKATQQASCGVGAEARAVCPQNLSLRGSLLPPSSRQKNTHRKPSFHAGGKKRPEWKWDLARVPRQVGTGARTQTWGSRLPRSALPLLEEPGEPDRTGSVGVWCRTAGKNQVLETCAWAHIPALPLGSCVCLGKSLHLSAPQKRAETVALGCQRAVLEMGGNNTGLGLRATPFEVPVFTHPTMLAQSPSDSTPTHSQH